MRFDGTDTTLLISSSGNDAGFQDEFKKAYQQEFGFLLESRVMVDDINVCHRMRLATRGVTPEYWLS